MRLLKNLYYGHQWLLAILLTLLLPFLASGMENEDCFECHNDPNIKAETERGASLTLYVPETKFEWSLHGYLQCTECHVAEKETGFDTVPHLLMEKQVNNCLDCHGDFFYDINRSYFDSVHLKNQRENFSCVSCHDPHSITYFHEREENKAVLDRIQYSNKSCLSCHTEPIAGVSSDRTIPGLEDSHESLIHPHIHLAAVRCVDCHTDPEDSTKHLIRSKKDTTPCVFCHQPDSILLTTLFQPPTPQKTEFKWLGKGLFNDTALIEKIKKAGGIIDPSPVLVQTDQEANLEPEPLFRQLYLTGASRIKWLERSFGLAMLVIIMLIAIHGGIRFLMSGRKTVSINQIDREYIYTLPVRLWHWINAGLMVLLILSGYTMHYTGNNTSFFNFEWAAHMHQVCGVLTIVLFLLYIGGSISSGNIKNYLPQRKGFLRSILRQAQYYFWGIIKGSPKPFHPHKGKKFNEIQKMTYIVVVFLLVPVLSFSGLALLLPRHIPAEIMDLNGTLVIAIVHYISAGALVLFLLIHIYLISTGDKLSYLLKAMITGVHQSEK